MRAPLAAMCIGAVLMSAAALDAASPSTSLRVTYWESSANASSRVTWTLRCDPPRGSLPRPTRACKKLARGGSRLFAPLQPDAVCTEIYGGPQKARVVGRVNGKRVWATFTRSNGCEIGRWQRISPWLVPTGGVTS
jgi:Subtilisin inhibitor-like